MADGNFSYAFLHDQFTVARPLPGPRGAGNAPLIRGLCEQEGNKVLTGFGKVRAAGPA